MNVRTATLPGSAHPGSPPRGRATATLFCLFFGGIGLLFAVVVARELWMAGRTYLWSATPCRIAASRVAEPGPDPKALPYRFEVAYDYEAGGQTHRSAVYAPKYEGTYDYGDALGLTRRYAVGSAATCYVNPADPNEAILDRPGLWLSLAFPVPLLLLAFGAGGLYATWARRPGTMMMPPVSAAAPPARPWRGAWGEAALFGVFFVVGAALVNPVIVGPLARWADARDWRETSATVVSSRVLVDDGGEDIAYRPDVLYEYTAGGEAMRSNRLRLVGAPSGDSRSAEAFADRYSPGSALRCYVNPADPADAVVDRSLPRRVYFGAIPIAFVLVGGLGFASSARKARALSAEANFRR